MELVLGSLCIPVTSAKSFITTTVTSLEVTRRPNRYLKKPRRADLSGIWRADPPSISFYRFLYNTIGRPWYWYVRRTMSDEALREIIEDPKVEVYVPQVRGTPAGYLELDRRVAGEVEIAYLGLLPEFIGRGIGPWLLDFGVQRAWREDCERVWVHTCTTDHPSALAMYQRAGMQVFKREQHEVALCELVEAGFDCTPLL